MWFCFGIKLNHCRFGQYSSARHEWLTVNLLKHFVIGRGIDGTRCDMQSAVTVNNGVIPREVQIPVS